MNTHPDFEELLRLLGKHDVDYMMEGGYPVARHGYPRFTKDLDIFFLGLSKMLTTFAAHLLRLDSRKKTCLRRHL